MADYPAAIFVPRTTENLSGVTYDPTKTKEVFAEDYSLVAAEVAAIENALGTDLSNIPAGASFVGSVAYATMFPQTTEIDIIVPNVVLLAINVADNPIVETVAFPFLISVVGDVFFSSVYEITSIAAPALSSIGGNFTLQNVGSLAALDISSLISVGGDLYIQSAFPLTVLDLSNVVVSGANYTIGSASYLADLTINSAMPCTNYLLQGLALSEASVDGILAAIDTAGVSGGVVELDYGTSSAPSAAGLVSKANLEAKGWTVTTN